MSNHRIVYDTFHPRQGSRTKMDILVERAAFLASKAADAAAYIESLHNTRCGLKCGGCGEYLATEADFAGHFSIPNEQYLNLGDCPNPTTD